MKKSKVDLSLLKEDDVYSLIMHAIYKCTNDPKYATLSELIYTLDRKSLFNLCSVFGGTTIKIPTVDDLKIYANALLVYQNVVRGMTFKEAFKKTGINRKYRKEVALIFKELGDILDEQP